jgi:hypothetical protein
MAKHMCTDHEELYKNLLKSQMKVGNELVAQVSNKNRLNRLMQTTLIMPEVHNTLFWLEIKAYHQECRYLINATHLMFPLIH